MELQGRHALVTGGGTGIGAAIARNLAAAGARLTLVGRRPEPLQAVAAELNHCQVVTADLTQEDDVARMAAAASRSHGAVDILVANAGAASSAPLVKTDLETWNALMAINLTSPFLCARAVLPPMLEAGWGRIVFIASTASLTGAPYIAAYTAAKHGVLGLARSLAKEVAAKGVTVNAVCPGYTETPMLERTVENIMAKTGFDADKARAAVLRGNPLGRFIQPEEVASTVGWLCGDGAASVNGAAIPLSGGEI